MVELRLEALSRSSDVVTVVMTDEGEIFGQYLGGKWQEWACVDPTRVTLARFCEWLYARGYPVVMLVDSMADSGVN